MSWEWISCLR